MKLSMSRGLICMFAACLSVMAATATAIAATAVAADAKPGTGIIKTLAAGIPHAAFFGISFDGGKGVAVGAGGVIFGSADAGQTWVPIKHGKTELALLAVAMRGTHTIAVGQAGVVMIREPTGQWTKIDIGAATRLFSVSLNNAGFAVAVGEFGTVLKSADGGRTWTSTAPDWSKMADAEAPGTGEPSIYAAHVTESGEITIAGEFGVMLRSSDGGATWRVLRAVTPGQPTLFAMYFPNGAGNSYAVGQTGELLTSEDRGLSWARCGTNTQSNFLGVTQSASGQVVITGMRVMMRSQNSGSTWVPVEEGDTTTDWYQAVQAEPSTGRIIAVGHSGRIIQIGS